MYSLSTLSLFSNVGIFLFFALNLGVNRGPLIGSIVILISAIAALPLYKGFSQFKESLVLLVLLSLTSLCMTLISFLHGNSLSNIDLASRYILSVPVFLVMLRLTPNVKLFLTGCAVGCWLGLLVGAWQIIGLDFERAIGFTGVIQFGNIALLMGLFSLAGLFYEPEKNSTYWKMFLSISGLVGIYVSFLSGSRGGWIAIPIALIVFITPIYSRDKLKKLLFCVLIGGAAIATIASQSNSLNKRLEVAKTDIVAYGYGNTETSIGARLGLWVYVTKMISEKPLFGWSDSDYQQGLKELVRLDPSKATMAGLANTHNSILEVTVFSGIVGLIPFLLLLGYPFIFFVRGLRSISSLERFASVSGTSLIGCYFVMSQSQVMFHRNNTLMFFLISLAILWSYLKKSQIRSAQV